MNEYDSEIVRAILKNGSFRMTQSLPDADVILLNTCAIRESAHSRIHGRLGHVHQLKRRNPALVVGLLGCMAQSLQEEILERHPVVDLVVGPDSYKRLPRLIHAVCDAGGKGLEIDLSEYETYSDVYPERRPGVNAWIACMRGCDNFCTFCVVPYTRGRERSRDPESVVAEARRLAAEGYKQVTLLGQNVNSYRFDDTDFAALLLRVADVDGIERVRFTSPHPKDFPRPLLHAIASHARVCKHIHLPLQAGSDRILERMRRTYTKQEFLALVDEIRETIPEVCLSTDIICGFPGETEAEFEDTVDVVERVRFDSAFVFKYSERRNTIAQRKFDDDVPDALKTARVVRVNAIQKAISLARNRDRIGRRVEVLLERPSRKSADDLLGRDDGNRCVVVPRGDLKPGDFAQVRIEAASANTLLGHALRGSLGRVRERV
ncbi:MAG: tRNA (N6-isopentenyl adenosine(37)-C2)-methylthiotransferase MiaB [Candidatus Latescibacterota bacterium]|nr:MAG: tRNA (N6-isopentenyl adenosine(37)-C2)-methylthiotransferase MiaB [Candidatus Latescibacterota bacterium]